MTAMSFWKAKFLDPLPYFQTVADASFSVVLFYSVLFLGPLIVLVTTRVDPDHQFRGKLQQKLIFSLDEWNRCIFKNTLCFEEYWEWIGVEKLFYKSELVGDQFELLRKNIKYFNNINWIGRTLVDFKLGSKICIVASRLPALLLEMVCMKGQNCNWTSKYSRTDVK